MKTLEIEILAYRLWQERGMPLGSPDEDWFEAEEQIKQQYTRIELSMNEGPSLFAYGMGKRTS